MNKLTLIVFVGLAAGILYYSMGDEIFVHIGNPVLQTVLLLTIFVFVILAIYGGRKYARGSTSLKTDEILYPIGSKITGTLIFSAQAPVTIEKAHIVLECAKKNSSSFIDRPYKMVYFKINNPVYTQTLAFNEQRQIQKGEEVTFEFSFEVPDSKHKELDRTYNRSNLVWRLRSEINAEKSIYKDIAFFSIENYS